MGPGRRFGAQDYDGIFLCGTGRYLEGNSGGLSVGKGLLHEVYLLGSGGWGDESNQTRVPSDYRFLEKLKKKKGVL